MKINILLQRNNLKKNVKIVQKCAKVKELEKVLGEAEQGDKELQKTLGWKSFKVILEILCPQFVRNFMLCGTF